MAQKHYGVKYAFGARTKDGKIVYVTRALSAKIPELLSAGDIKRHLAAGNLVDNSPDVPTDEPSTTTRAARSGRGTGE